ncbi:MAG TPA: S26 family signal peptidase, partial [Planctomycetota bacterium]|nr:S26 family signal peptidase [Planctomycetota bacterium]
QEPDAVPAQGPAPLPLPATGKVRLALEHFDGTIRVVLYDLATGAETASSGFAYNPAPRAMKQYSAGVRLKGEGTDVVFEKIQIARDLYYLWDEFKMMEDGGVAGNLAYRTDNAGMLQLPDGFLVHRADGLTEFVLKAAEHPQDPNGGFLMCGDNTVSSVDGRYFGPVERWRFTGKYWFTFWPPSRAMAVR